MDLKRSWGLFVYILCIIISSIYAKTQMARPSFVWKGQSLTITCVRRPTLDDSTMVLLREKKNVITDTLEYSAVFSRAIPEINTDIYIDELVCNKGIAGYEDAKNFECVTCYGTGHTNCPGGGTEERATDSIIIGNLQPPVPLNENEATSVIVPEPISYVFMYTGPDKESLKNIKWFYNDIVLPSDFSTVEGETIIEQYSLTFHRFTKDPSDREDSGLYMLQYSREVKNPNQTNPDVVTFFIRWNIIIVKLTVDGPPISTGTTSTINCVSWEQETGVTLPIDSNPSFSWEYFGIPVNDALELSGKTTVSKPNDKESSIDISPPDPITAGEYTCVFSYLTEGISKTIAETFELNALSVVSSLTGKMLYKVGETLVLTCKVLGWPRPEITWNRNDQTIMDISSSDRVTITESWDKSETTSVLEITRMTINDVSQYHCEAKNNELQQPSSKTTSINIEVGAGSTDISFPAMVWEGSQMMITCTNNPAQSDSTMVLFKGGVNVDQLDFNVKKTTMYVPSYDGNVDRLTATKTVSTYSDAGLYRCYTCTGNNNLLCPNGADMMKDDSGIVLVGAMEPIGVVYHSAPNQLSFTLKYAGAAVLENVVWTKDSQSLSLFGFDISRGSVTENNVGLTTYIANKISTVQADEGLYAVEFDYPLSHSVGTREILQGEADAQVIILRLTIEGPSEAVIGGFTTLRCIVSDTSDQTSNEHFSWFFNEVNIDTAPELQGKYTESEQGNIGSLTISNSDAAVGGKYTCKYTYTSQLGLRQSSTTSKVLNSPSDVIELSGTAVVNEGNIIQLTCISYGNPKPTITWYRGNEQIFDSQARVTLSPGYPVNSLEISGSTADDAGLYKCRASNIFNTVGDTDSFNVDVIKTRADNVVLQLPLYVWEGDSLTINCFSVPPMSDSTLFLEKNGVLVVSPEFNIIVKKDEYDNVLNTRVDKMSAFKNNISFNDAAEYRCISCASNRYTECLQNADVIMEDRQSLLVGNLNPDVGTHYNLIGTPLTIQFSYTGPGIVENLVWRKGQTEVAAKGFTVTESNNNLGNLLLVTSTIVKSSSVSTDSGTYTVEFVRKLRDGITTVRQEPYQKSVTVETFGLEMIVPDTVIENTNSQLACGISELNRVQVISPVYQWFFNGVRVSQVSHLVNRYREDVQGAISYLIILDSDSQDGGEYTCIFSFATPEGNVQTLTVKDIMKAPAAAVEIRGDTSVFQDATLTLICTAYGYPTPTVVWSKDNVAISDVYARVTITSQPPGYTLQRTGMIRTDEGDYKCTARNSENPSGSSETVPVTVIQTRPDSLDIRSVLYVWVDEFLTISCVAIPAVAQTTLTLFDDGVNVNRRGFTVDTQHNVRDFSTGMQVSMLNATKSRAKLADAKLYTCSACAASRDTQCSAGQTYMDTTRTIVVGMFDPDVVTVYHLVPASLTMTFSYASQDGVTLESITWSRDNVDVSDYGFTLSSGTDTIGGIDVITQSITKENTIIHDDGTYRLSFVRRIRGESNRKKRQIVVIEQEIFQKVVIVETFELKVTGPTVVMDNTNTVLTCTVADPIGQFASQITNPSIEWLFNGRPVYEISFLRNRNHEIFSNGVSTLTISNSDSTVAGEYTCMYSYTSLTGQRETVSQVKAVNGRALAGTPTGITAIDQDDTLTLTCEVHGYPYPTVSWQRNGLPLSTADSRVSYASDPPSPYYHLTITDIGRSDIGEYTCTATNIYGRSNSQQSVNVDVFIIHPDTVTIETTLFVWRKTRFTITCVAGPTVPQMTLVLLRDGINVSDQGFNVDVSKNVLDRTTNTQVDQLTATLDITNFKDADTYTCVACSGNRHYNCPSASRKIEDSRPVLVGRLDPITESISAASSDPIEISVIYTGPGTIENLIWKKDVTRVSTIGFISSTSDDRVSGFDVKRHTIRKTASVFSDAGTFLASFTVTYRDGSTDIASQHFSNSIDVHMFGLELQVPTTIVTGAVTKMTCRIVDRNGDFTAASTDPFTWQYFGNAPEIFPQLYGNIAKTTNNIQSTLMISNSDERLAGEYTCIYTYLSGSTERTITRTETINGAPKIERINGYLNYYEDERMVLKCMSYGYPVSDVTWYKNDDILSSADSRIEMTSTYGNPEHILVIKDLKPSDEGKYRCQATPSIGSTPISMSVDVTVNDAPKQGLDLPLIIAIIVGVILALMILVGILVCCRMRQRKHAHVFEESVSETVESVTEVEEMKPSPKPGIFVPMAGYPVQSADYGEWFGQDHVLYKGHALYERPTHMWRPYDMTGN